MIAYYLNKRFIMSGIAIGENQLPEQTPPQQQQTFDELRAVTAQHNKDLKSQVPVSKSLKEHLEDAAKAIEEGNFAKAKISINIHKDQQRGILSRYIDKDETGKSLTMPVYLSDQRSGLDAAGNRQEKDTFENWAVMGLTYFQTAVRMMDMEIGKLDKTNSDHIKKIASLKENQEYMQKKAGVFLQQIRGMTSADAKNYMSTIVQGVVVPDLAAALGKTSEEDSKKLLKDIQKLKDFTNMDEPPVASITMTRDGKPNNQFDKTCMDLPLYQLTANQKQWFENIRDKKDEPEWFKQLTSTQQDFMRYYSPHILAGRAIPTQLLKFAPILRNAEKTEMDMVKINDPKAQIHENFEELVIGNLAYQIDGSKETKEQQAENTAESIRQVQALTGSESLYINSLTTGQWLRALAFKLQGKQDEGELIAQVSSAVEVVTASDEIKVADKSVVGQLYETGRALYETGKGVFVDSQERLNKNVVNGNTPLNMFGRNLEGNDTAAFTKIRDKVDKKISEALRDPDIKDEQKYLIIKLRQLRQEDQAQQGFIWGSNADNMQLAANMQIMASLLNQNNKLAGKPVDDTLVQFCKSSKDRRGEVRALSEALATTQEIELAHLRDLPSDALDKIFREKPAEIYGDGRVKSVDQDFDSRESIRLSERPTLDNSIQTRHEERASSNDEFSALIVSNTKIVPAVKARSYNQIYYSDTFKSTMKEALYRIRGKAATQSYGAEGVKDKEGITRTYIVGAPNPYTLTGFASYLKSYFVSSPEQNKLLKDTAKCNDKLPKIDKEQSENIVNGFENAYALNDVVKKQEKFAVEMARELGEDPKAAAHALSDEQHEINMADETDNDAGWNIYPDDPITALKAEKAGPDLETVERADILKAHSMNSDFVAGKPAPEPNVAETDDETESESLK